MLTNQQIERQHSNSNILKPTSVTLSSGDRYKVRDWSTVNEYRCYLRSVFNPLWIEIVWMENDFQSPRIIIHIFPCADYSYYILSELDPKHFSNSYWLSDIVIFCPVIQKKNVNINSFTFTTYSLWWHTRGKIISKAMKFPRHTSSIYDYKIGVVLIRADKAHLVLIYVDLKGSSPK